MTLKHLVIFYEVCKAESITLAAQRLNISQPAVSVVIKDLETYYGVKLFERMNRRIYLTDAGELLCNYVQTILNYLDEAKNILTESKQLTPIRLGSNISYAISYLPEILKEFTLKYPEIMISTFVNNSSDIEKNLLNHELDFAIVDNLSSSPLIKHQLIKKTHMIAVCSPNYPLHLNKTFLLDDLCHENFLLREPGSGSRTAVEQIFAKNGLSIVPVISSVSSQFLILSAQEGLGITFLPKAIAAHYIALKKLREIPIADVSFPRNYYLMVHKNKFVTKSMQSLMDYIVLHTTSA